MNHFFKNKVCVFCFEETEDYVIFFIMNLRIYYLDLQTM